MCPPDELFDPPCRANRLPGYRLFTFLRGLGLKITGELCAARFGFWSCVSRGCRQRG
jgi:hypothetical protein